MAPTAPRFRTALSAATGLTLVAWCGVPVPAGAAAPAAFTIVDAPTVGPSARDVVGLFRRTHRIGFGVTVPNGYVDGGRDSRLDAAGRVVSTREVLMVDRDRDARLRKALEFAGSTEVRDLPVDERARRLADSVRSTFAPRGDRSAPFAGDAQLADECRGRGVLLGEVPDLCNGGACRHQALLFKILADEAGLDAALVRGGYLKDGRDKPGAHAWCEVEAADGGLLVIDTMRRQGPCIALSDPQARRYLDVAHRPLYGRDGPRQNLAIVAATRPPFIDEAQVHIVPPAQPDVTVHYSLDGSEPGAGSPRAEGPVRVPATCTVKAVAIGADGAVVDRVGRLVVVTPSRGEAKPGGLPQTSAN